MRSFPASRQRAAAAVEFALVAPVVLLMLLGMTDLAMAVNAQAIVGNASREGARAASFGVNSPAQMTAALSAISGATSSLVTSQLGTTAISYQHGSSNPWVACSLTNGCVSSTAGDAIKVTVTYTYKWMSPALLGLPGATTIGVTTEMRIETS